MNLTMSLLAESSRVKVLRGIEANRDGEGSVMLPRGSKKLGLVGLEAVYRGKGEPFYLFSLNS